MNTRANLRLLLLAALLSLLASLTFGPAAAAADDHPLTVTAQTSASCDWSITKTAPAHLTLNLNETFDIPYTVTVTKTCTYRVHGTVSGTDGYDHLAVTVSDGGANTAATISGCTTDDHHVFTCTYDADVRSTADGTVSATATYPGGAVEHGSTTYSFTGVTPLHNAVDVVDSALTSPLATHLDHSATYHYTVPVSFSSCGHFAHTNTASLAEGDHTIASASATVTIDVPCAGGCTLTQGYWKTHSKYGPAPSDPTWKLLAPSGPDSPFFLSGQTWYQVFNTSPAGGNAYYILAHQYMAAVLNMLNGASSVASVDAALAWAKTFFQTYTPAQIGALKGSDPLRAAAIAAASTLERYNTGAIGPGHCDE